MVAGSGVDAVHAQRLEAVAFWCAFQDPTHYCRGNQRCLGLLTTVARAGQPDQVVTDKSGFDKGNRWMHRRVSATRFLLAHGLDLPKGAAVASCRYLIRRWCTILRKSVRWGGRAGLHGRFRGFRGRSRLREDGSARQWTGILFSLFGKRCLGAFFSWRFVLSVDLRRAHSLLVWLTGPLV